MATITRYQAEQYITQVFNEYLEALKKAKKNKKKILPEAYELFEGMEEFNQFVKSVDLQQKVYNRLNIQGIEELLTGCVNLSKLYDLQVYDSIKDIRISEDDHYYKITNAVTSYSVGGTYTFNIEPINEIEKQWYEFYTKTWNCYKFNESTKKYEEYVVGLNEQRMVLDTNTNDRTFLFTEPGKYRITAAVFKQSWNPFAQQIPELNEVDEIEINVKNDVDSKIANLGLKEKVAKAVSYADLGDAFKNLGYDILMISVTILAFAGIGTLLKKIPAKKLKPFLIKIAEKLAIPELMAFIGTYGDAFDIAMFVVSVCDFVEQVTNAKNEEQLRIAGKTFEKVVETFGLVVVMTFMNIVGNKLKKNDIEKEVTAFDETEANNLDNDVLVKNVEIKKLCKDFPESFIQKISKLDNSDEVFEILNNKQEYVKYLNEKILNKIADSSDAKTALQNMIKQNEELERIGNEKAWEIIKLKETKPNSPCLSTIYDSELKQYFYGQNFNKNQNGKIAYKNFTEYEADTIIQEKHSAYLEKIRNKDIVPSDYSDQRRIGHSEVVALNHCLKARREAGLPVNLEVIDNLYVYNVDLWETYYNLRKLRIEQIIVKERCENCKIITQGINTILHE